MLYFIAYFVGFFVGFIYASAVEEEEYISLSQKGQDYLDNLNNSDSTKQP